MKRVALAAVLAALMCASASGQAVEGGGIVVLPFENGGADRWLAWMREGVASLLGEALAARGLAVVDREERDIAFDRLQLPVTAVLSRASAIKIGQAVGAGTLVLGRYEVSGDALVLRAQVVDLDSGRIDPVQAVEESREGLFDVVDRLAARVSGRDTAVASWRPPSVPAFEWYTRGVTADSTAAARTALEQALQVAPGYDAVRLALWRLHTEEGEHEEALARLTPVAPDSLLRHDARFLSAISHINLGRHAEAFATLRELYTEAPLAAVANALGVVQLRRGGTPETGRATYYFNLATEIAPGEADFYFNLGYAYWLEHDANGAIYWLREAVRRAPGDGDAHLVLAAALQRRGATAEAARERELAVRLSSRGATTAAAPALSAPHGLERLHARLQDRAALVDMRLAASGQREQAALAAFHLEAGRRAVEGGADRDALQALQRAIYLSPYLAEAHVLLGRLHLRAGRTVDAIQALTIAVWSEESVATLIALAEAYLEADDVTRARAAVERARVLDPRAPAAIALEARLPPR